MKSGREDSIGARVEMTDSVMVLLCWRVSTFQTQEK